jgi:hypothetical protein
VRADDVKTTNFIHVDILQRLLECPMAVCDLSSANPNVLFELALRQAFDKPVALIQEQGTRQIFDIGPLRCRNYRRARLYHEVLEDQKHIADAIAATYEDRDNERSINSIVRLLSLSKPAALHEVSKDDVESGLLKLLFDEVASLKAMLKPRQEQSVPRPRGDAHLRDAEAALAEVAACEFFLDARNNESIREFENAVSQCEKILAAVPKEMTIPQWTKHSELVAKLKESRRNVETEILRVKQESSS